MVEEGGGRESGEGAAVVTNQRPARRKSREETGIICVHVWIVRHSFV